MCVTLGVTKGKAAASVLSYVIICHCSVGSTALFQHWGFGQSNTGARPSKMSVSKAGPLKRGTEAKTNLDSATCESPPSEQNIRASRTVLHHIQVSVQSSHDVNHASLLPLLGDKREKKQNKKPTGHVTNNVLNVKADRWRDESAKHGLKRRYAREECGAGTLLRLASTRKGNKGEGATETQRETSSIRLCL